MVFTKGVIVMSEYNYNESTYGVSGVNAYITKVFTKMGLGLLVTALVAFITEYFGLYYRYYMMTGGIGTILLVFVQFGLCISMGRNLADRDTRTTNLLFMCYAAVTGFTFSTLFAVYGTGTLVGAFAFTSVLFFSMAIIGHTTNVDISRFSGLLMGGLIALLITTVVSMFIPALRSSLLISYLGIIVFLGLTAWDMQRIKQIYYQTGGYGTAAENLAVYGAFELYLDFLNIFLYVLRILGTSREN